MKPRTVIAIIVAIACTAGFIWIRASQNKGPALDASVHTPRIQTVKAAVVKKESTLSLTGTVAANQGASVSSKVAGRISRLDVQNGDAVSAGQVLIQLEDTLYRNALAVDQAALSKARANQASIQLNHDRVKALLESGAASQKDLDDLESALTVAQADVSAAEAAVAIAQENLSSTRITSPISGLAANRFAELGQMVAPGTPLLAVEDLSSVKLIVDVEQKDLGEVVPGLTVEVSVEGFENTPFTGTVERINPSGKAAARVFATEISIPNRENRLKSGMFAKAVIRLGEPADVIAVPMDALAGNQGQYHVFLIEGDHVRRQAVEVGNTMGKMVEIRSGLTEGQAIAGTNVNKLKDQDRILVVQ